MYKIVGSSASPLDGDTWQNSFLKDYQWAVLQNLEKTESENNSAPPVLLILRPPDEETQLPIPSYNVKRPFQCAVCNKVFKMHHNFKKHKCKVKKSENRQECNICHGTYFDTSTLKRHMKLHARTNPYRCKKCNKVFLTKMFYDRHCQLPDCNMTSRNTFGYNVITTGKRGSVAPMPFKQKRIYSDDEKIYECQDCLKRFAKKNSLFIHRRIHLPFSCNTCKQSFSIKTHFIEHLSTCNLFKKTPKKKHNHPYFCELCQKPFPLRSNFEEHMRVHTGQRPYECEVCYKRFTSRGILNVHMRTHTGEKPYKCEYCGKAFAEKTKLNTHKQYHTGFGSHECMFCKKVFARPRYLQNHYRIHLNERPFECEICHEKFTVKTAYNKHKKSQHNCEL